MGVESGKKALGIIPETFDCVITALAAKLSAGVSSKLKQCHKTLASSMSKEVLGAMKEDFILYLKIRSDLYQAIALKYLGKLMKNEEKHGETVACYQGALNILKHAASKFPTDSDRKKKKRPAKGPSHSVVVMNKSINKQKQGVKALFDAA